MLRCFDRTSRFVVAAILIGLSLVGAAPAAWAALAVAVEANPDLAKPGEPVIVEITVSNTSGSAANVVLDSVVPAQIAAFSQFFASADANCRTSDNSTTCSPGEAVRWTIGALAAGEVRRFSFPATVGAATPDGTPIVFPAQVFENAALAANDASTVVVGTSPVLDLSVDEDRNPVAPGELLTYTLAFGNEGGVSVTGTTLRFPLPAGTSFVSASSGGVLNGSAVEWSVGTLASGIGDTRQVTVSVGGGLASGTLLRTTALLQDASARVARAQVVTPVQAGTALGLAIEANPDPAKGGEPVLYQLTVTNRGASPLNDVVLDARVPVGVDAFSQFLTTGSASCLTGDNSTTCSVTERVQWSLGTLAPGTTRTVSMPPPVSGATLDGSLLRMTASVTATGGDEAGASASTLVQDAPLLDLALDEDRNPAAPGEPLTYTLAFGNEGGVSVTGTTLRFPLPAGTSFVSASSGGVLNAGAVEWSLGTLATGVGGTRQVTVSAGGGLANGSVLRTTASLRDASARVARAQAVTPVQGGTVLGLAIEANPDPAKGGEPVLYQLTVTNRGALPLNDLILDARVPFGVDAFSQFLTTGSASCLTGDNSTTCSVNERVQWALGTLAPGTTRTVSMPPPVSGAAPDGSHLRLTALVRATGGDEAGASASTLVQDAPVLDLALDEDRNPAAPGEPLTYTLAFGNEGGVSVTGATLRFPLPAGTSFVSASSGGVLNGSAVEWSIGTLAAGVGDTRQVTVSAGGGLANGSVLRATASLEDASARVARAQAVTPVQGGTALGLAIEANADPVKGGETLLYHLTVTNRGALPLNDLILDARVPFGVDAFSQFLTTGSASCLTGDNSTTCSVNERVQWALGTLAPGTTRTVSMPPPVSGAAPDGSHLRLTALVRATGGDEAGASTSTLVRDAPVLDLALDEDRNPVAPGEQLTYTLAFGNESGVSVTGATLRFPLPAGASLVSASSGGVLNGSAVEWSLGTLAAGVGDTRRVTLRANAAVGSVLRFDPAELRASTAAGPIAARARAFTSVEVAPSLRTRVTLLPTAGTAGQTVSVQILLENAGVGALSDVILDARVPAGIAAFGQALASPGASCLTADNSTTCSPVERIRWTLGALAPSETRLLTYPATIAAGSVLGDHRRVTAFAQDVSGRVAQVGAAIRVGLPLDSDGDGIANPVDNCPYEANPLQEDVGGVGTGGDPDGIGNACQCGDVNGDGRVTLTDAVVIQRSLLTPPTATLARPDLCDVGGSAGCSVADAVIVRRSLLVPPTARIAQVCPADLP